MLSTISVPFSKGTSEHAVFTLADVPDLPHPHELVLKANLSGDDLSIDLVHQPSGRNPSRRAAFRFDALRGDVTAAPAHGAVGGDHPPLVGLNRRFMGLSGTGGLAAATSAEAPAGFPILKGGPAFVVTTLNQYYGKPLAAPFFLTDAQRSYFVACEPSTTTVLKIVDTPSSAAVAVPKGLSATAFETTATLASANLADAKPWLRAQAKATTLASAAFLQSAAEPLPSSQFAKTVDFVQRSILKPVSATTVATTFTPFFHPFVDAFTIAVQKYGLDKLFTLAIQASSLAAAQPFKVRYAPDPHQVKNPDMVEAVDFGAGTPFGVYNNELFLHLPLMLQAMLCQNGKPVEGLKWGARVCDLLGAETDPADAWKFLPFRQQGDTPSFTELLDSLAAGPDDPRRKAALAQIEASQLYPFQPFQIARLRPDAMKKYAFLQVFNARFDLADQHFRRYTPEDVNEALLHYLVLDAALSFRMEVLPAQPTPSKTYAELRPHLDAAGDAVLTIETKLGALSAVGAPVAPGSGQAANLKLVASRYFCVPPNQKLFELWDKVADRLNKIRNGLTIDGVRRPVGLFGPKIDPAMLVQAAAGAGLSAAADAASGGDRPNHRFPVQMRLLRERIERLATINASLLQTLKEGDAEHLAAMRTRHEGEMLGFIGEVRQAQIEEAEQILSALAAQREAVMVRWRHYREQLGFDDLAEPATNLATGEITQNGQRDAARAFKLVDGAGVSITLSDPTGTVPGSLSADISLQTGKILAQEREEVLMSFAAAAAHGMASHLEAVGGILKALPGFEAAAKPMGAGAGVHIGGVNLGGAVEAGAREVGTLASAFSFLSTNAGKQASFVWRERDFALQLKAAAAEALHIDRLMITAGKTLASRQKELTVNDEQAKRNSAVLDYLGSKFSAEAFHLTMAAQLSILQKQAWSAAFDKYNDARATFAFDFSPLDVPPTPPHLFDAAPKGLLSADSLMLAAHALESAYIAKDERRLELTRTFSLKQVNPFALMRLRETGHCEFKLTEALHDLDNPGHYDRRMVDVRLSIPGVTGPYIPISATLQLADSQVRDVHGVTRSIQLPHACSLIVTSSGREDAGMFQPDRPDDRYGPFEGAGGESSWTLDLPPDFRQFPYRTVPDVLMTVRLRTQRDDALVVPTRNKVAAALDALQPEGGRTGSFQLVSARHDFPDDWRRWERAPDQPLKLTFTRANLPYALRKPAKVKSGLVLWAIPGAFLTDADIAAAPSVTVSPDAGDLDAWDLTVPPPGGPREEAYLLLNYTLAA